MKEQPQCEVGEYGVKRWWLNGQLHREDGPAVEWIDGAKDWYLHGKLHREDGPAVEYASRNKEWWLNDVEVHPEQVVDYHLSRGTFCYYNEETQTLHFAETK